MFGDLPPSSWATRLTVSAAAFATCAPARVEPVKDTMSMPGCAAIAAPTVGPSPLTRLKTPAGHAGLVQDLGEEDAVQRRDLGRLQHHRAAGGERRRDLAGDLVDRPVPRRDEAADADRLAHDAGRCRGSRRTRTYFRISQRLHQVRERRPAPARRSPATSARPSRARSSRRSRRGAPCRPRSRARAARCAPRARCGRRSRTPRAPRRPPCRRRRRCRG